MTTTQTTQAQTTSPDMPRYMVRYLCHRASLPASYDLDRERCTIRSNYHGELRRAAIADGWLLASGKLTMAAFCKLLNLEATSIEARRAVARIKAGGYDLAE